MTADVAALAETAAVDPVVSPRQVIATAALSAAGAAWMAGGVFRDPLARGAGALGVAVAVAMLLLAARLHRPALVQGAGVPLVALGVGGALVAPSAGAGAASIPSLVAAAVRNGGILQPPLPFDPGWRLILVVLFAVATAAAASVALGLNRPRLAVLVPVPVTVLASLVQPDGAVLVSALGATALTGAAMAIAYGAELSLSSGLSLHFERNRLLRGAALMLALVVLLGAVSRLGILFPDTQRDVASPPQKPQVAASPPDHTLFTVTFSGAARTTPLRVGVLDTYDASQQAWLLPAYDSHRFTELSPPTAIPGQRPGRAVLATIVVDDSGGGHGIPTIPGASTVSGADGAVLQYDPQTGGLLLRDHPVPPGFEYVVAAAAPPTAAQLRAAAPVPADVLPFLNVPPAPPAITALLANAPQTPFDRMQFLRQQLYAKVTAAGTGAPVDVGVSRVVQMLGGGTATPYELTAAEALLARWAGVPSRIGYGFIGGRTTATAALAVHPDDGAAWLEAYFAPYGWVDIIGQPPRAQASIGQSAHPNPAIAPSDRLSLVVYVPVRVHTSLALYEVLRYWLVVALPVAAVLAVLVALLPVAARQVRARRRRRWAQHAGPLGRVGAAYATMRDLAADLGIGARTATPLEFVAAVAPDAEHEELAWLVTRCVWGDLRRDLRDDDADTAEEMAASVARRLRRGQPAVTRLLALLSRTSLRTPYSDEVPNAWPSHHARLPRLRRRGTRRLALRRALPALAGTVVAVLVVVAATATTAAAPVAPPARDAGAERALAALVPPSIGSLTLSRQRAAEAAYTHAGPDALVSAGQVYTVDQGVAVQASFQVSLLKPGLPADDTAIVTELRSKLASASFVPLTVPVPLFDGHCRCAAGFHDTEVDELDSHFDARIWVGRLPSQRIYFWFPPGGRSLAILVVRSAVGVTAADGLALALSDYEHGAAVDPVPLPSLPAATGGAS